MSVMTAAKSQTELRTPLFSMAFKVLAAAIAAGVIAGILFYLLPQIDIDASSLFYYGDGVFYGKSSKGVHTLRSILLGANVVVYVVAFIGLIVSLLLKRPWLKISTPKWLFLVVCLVVGPGLTSNVILKDNWGRARPDQIVEFGGKKIYSPPVLISDQCPRNCSFVAGEASTVYITFFAIAFMFPWRARRLIVAGIVAGSLAGLVRMMQGAHFLSDVIFAGITMALIAAAVQLIFEAAERAGHKKADTKTNDTLA
jgi:lipid A 4'-phosphatase